MPQRAGKGIAGAMLSQPPAPDHRRLTGAEDANVHWWNVPRVQAHTPCMQPLHAGLALDHLQPITFHRRTDAAGLFVGCAATFRGWSV